MGMVADRVFWTDPTDPAGGSTWECGTCGATGAAVDNGAAFTALDAHIAAEHPGRGR